MEESKKLQILRLEYSNDNYQRAYEWADDLILSSLDDAETGMGWLYKGLCAAGLSDIDKERLREAVSYLQEAKKHGISHQSLGSAGIHLSISVYDHVARLCDFYSNASTNAIRSQDGKVIHHSNEDFSEHVGRELGQTLFDAAMYGPRSRKASVEVGQHFEQKHSAGIIAAINCALDLAPGDADVAENCAGAITMVIETPFLTLAAKQNFREDALAAREKILPLSPETSVSYLKDPDKLSCPSCGHTIVKVEKPERSRLFVVFLMVITGGAYILFYLIELFSGNTEVTSAKPGQKLICSTCGHKWIHEG